MSAPSPDTPRELVLVGGGHAHVEVLKRWAEQPVPGVRVTLVGDVDQAPYSGMLPGLVAGLYRHEEAHLDLPGLAAATGARWLRASARGVDPVARHLLLQDQDPLPYDVLSLNIGGTPALADLPGAAAHALPVKPVAGFLAGWEQALVEAGVPRPSSFRVVIVGGGAGGVELALSMVRRWRKVAATRPGPAPPLRCALVSASVSVPAGHPRGVQRHLTAALEQEGVELHLGERVASVDPQWVHAESGLQWAYDLLV